MGRNIPYQLLHIDVKHMGMKSWGGATSSSTIADDFFPH